MTLIGANAMQTTSLEERMTGNSKERNVAFQAAETTLRDAEGFLDSLADTTLFDGTGGLYGESQNEPANLFDVTQWSSARNYSGSLSTVNSQPRYMAKIMTESVPDTQALNIVGYGKRPPGSANVIFRVTSRGTGGTDQAQVILRTYFGKQL